MSSRRIAEGATVDGFLIGPVIHRGGMSVLRSVTHPDIAIPMLMKLPSVREGDDPAAIVGFEMEQLILPRLSGPHVPRFVALGDFTSDPYIVMERVSGTWLLPLLERLPLPYDEVAAIGAKVAAALSDIHRQHVVHLDVKPSNVLLRESGEAALIDFGLAHHDHLPDLMDEEFRVPYGTAPYMAPEQVLGHRRDTRSDLFSLGVLLYFFSTGVRPFGDPKGKRQLHRRLWRDPVPPRKLRPDYPLWLQEVVLRCLEVDPARRHPTAAQLALDLSNPDAVNLTMRSERLERDPWSAVIRRRFHPDAGWKAQQASGSAASAEHPDKPLAEQVSSAPIVAVAVDLTDSGDSLLTALRDTVERMLEVVPGARFACLNVLKQHRIALDFTLDEEGKNKHLARLTQLRHWAQPLRLAESRVTFHVLQAADPAAAILDYARTNEVDHIVMGARADSALKKILGSVSAEVVAKAPCTVTVVRPPARTR